MNGYYLLYGCKSNILGLSQQHFASSVALFSKPAAHCYTVQPYAECQYVRGWGSCIGLFCEPYIATLAQQPRILGLLSEVSRSSIASGCFSIASPYISVASSHCWIAYGCKWVASGRF
jgi:hypothetical protein